jgi:hypothetical protein
MEATSHAYCISAEDNFPVAVVASTLESDQALPYPLAATVASAFADGYRTARINALPVLDAAQLGVQIANNRVSYLKSGKHIDPEAAASLSALCFDPHTRTRVAVQVGHAIIQQVLDGGVQSPLMPLQWHHDGTVANSLDGTRRVSGRDVYSDPTIDCYNQEALPVQARYVLLGAPVRGIDGPRFASDARRRMLASQDPADVARGLIKLSHPVKIRRGAVAVVADVRLPYAPPQG